MERQQIDDKAIERAFMDTEHHMAFTLKKKGRHTFASRHEILGVLEEERHELVSAIHENKLPSEVRGELLDLAIVCVFAAACIDEDSLEW